ncbi:MAG: PAS domain-containing protein [Azonexus sp.]|nr:PAS domain-containing protein [Betaproteobacteria bacterium]MBK8917370.1 PAS domain-containing protein [Betaproteobacteria bacterium]MBP6035132.1 PAS domain-containing protein [Azonexus sp.]MBP6905890.1 PAS domain-containing protein [Azonexus sp.]
MSESRDTTQELLSLYELSLTVGRHLDARETCREFLRALVGQRNLAAASVWWRDGESGELALLDALPRRSVTRERLPAGHPLACAPRDLCGRPDAPLLDFLAPPLDAALGTWSLCPLGSQGILILHANRPQALAPRFVAQLRAVLEKLTTAIQGSLAFARLEESEARLHRQSRELDESRRLLEAIVEGTTDAIFVKDMEGRYLLANQATARVMGREQADILGCDDAALFDAETARSITALDRDVLARGTLMTFEEETVNGHGAASAFHTVKGPLRNRDGAIIGLFGIARDISERRRVEQALRTLSQALEQSPGSVIITDLEARIEYVNAAFVTTTGYAREAVLGQNPRLLQSGRTPSATFEALWASLLRGEPWQGEFINRRMNGEEYVEYARLAPVRQADGRITHYLAVNEDVTEKRRIADELARHRDHLEDLVEQRTRELQAATTAAEASARAKGAFLANMSHEIRTPLNAINGMAHLIRRDGLTPRQADKLTKLMAASDHLLAIINAILDLSRIDSERFELSSSPVDLAALVASVRDVLGNEARSKGLALESCLDVPAATLLGDETRLRQALLNYVANAIKFTATGNILIQVRTLREDEEGVLLRFSVQDTGIGIAADALPRLFSAFEQADNSTTRQYGGTGLGLAITRKLAELMGGKAGADSLPGRGSTFWFTARLAKGAQPREAEGAPDASESRLRRDFPGRRILVVEDEPVNREIVRLMLEDCGLRVDLAPDGAQAVTCAASSPYDLILMDVQMPVLDGLEATRRVRALPGGTRVPILALTANAFESDRERCRAAGMDDFLTKPVVPADLYGTVLRWLDRP